MCVCVIVAACTLKFAIISVELQKQATYFDGCVFMNLEGVSMCIVFTVV